MLMASSSRTGPSSRRADILSSPASTSLNNTASPAASLPTTGTGSATAIAWKKAAETLENSIPEKDFRRISSLTGPEDVLKELEIWQIKRGTSKLGAVINQVRDGLARMQGFNRALDLLAQGSPSPGCLLWGSIVFVLTMLRNATEEYDKICKALSRVIQCLPAIEIYAQVFSDSVLIQGCVSDFYCSLLRFWTKACKSYHRRHLWKFQRAWRDYDARFGELENGMIRCQERLEKIATAQHIHESRKAITEQQSVNAAILKAQDSQYHRDIIAWLAPTTYEVDYYVDDLVSARAARHVDTCRWVLAKDVFMQFNQKSLRQGTLLWIYAQPGAGKTVLSAFLIDYFSHGQVSHQPPVLYFFCRNTDAEKNKSNAILRSLVYQLFQALRRRSMSSSMSKDLNLALVESGQKKASNFDKMWQIFINRITDLAPATILVDALDECEDSPILIRKLQSLASSHQVAVVLISRKEDILYRLLHQSDSFEIMAEDVDADIKAFVDAKINASSCLSHPSVQNLVITRLCEPHQGMFLWVYLMWKELKSCVSVAEVQEALEQVPSELNAVFARILKELRGSLDKPTLSLCLKVLTWVVTAIRPLKIEELRQALTVHYQSEGHSLLCVDGSFPYSNKDIELVCGSLVHVRNGTLQLVHLTIKEYIQSGSQSDSSYLPIETQSASSQLALVCLSFLGSNCTRAITGFENSVVDPQQLRTNAPFIEYAVTFWMFHLTESEVQDRVEVSKQFLNTFISASTFCWLETYLALHPSNLPDLFIFLDAVRIWAIGSEEHGLSLGNSNFSFIADWCGAMEQVLHEYGQILVLRPFEIHNLNIGFAFSTGELTELYGKFGNVNAREESSRFEIHDHLRRPAREVPSHRRLQGDIRVLRAVFDILIYDPRRNVYFWSQVIENSNTIALFVQSATNGRQLRPVKWQVDSEEASNVCMPNIFAYDLRKDGKFMSIVVRLSDGTDVTLVWQIAEYLDFSIGLQAAPWAHLKFKCVSNHSLCTWVSNMSIAFRSDGGFCTPAGLVDSALKTLSPTSADDIRLLLDTDQDKTLYSGNGEFLFVMKCSGYLQVIKKFTWPDMQKIAEFDLWNMVRTASGTGPDAISSPIDRIDVEAISPSGRHIVFRYFFRYGSPLARFILLDTLTGNIVDMERDSDYGYPSLYFFDDESEINIVSLANDGELEVTNYAGLSSGDFSQSRQVIPGSKGSRLFYTGRIGNDDKIAIMISEYGAIRWTKFDENPAELLDEIEMIDSDPNEIVESRHYLSQNGARLAWFERRQDIICLQVFDIINKGERLRHLELCARSFTDPITMSHDLSILVIGTKIYNVGSPDDQIASRPFELINVVGEGYRQCVVDSSNTFIVFFPSIHRPQLDIFRLNVDGTSWAHLHPSLPIDEADFSAQFHPSLPLMAILCKIDSELPTLGHMSKISKNNRQTGRQLLPPYRIGIIDLNTGRLKPMDSLGNPKSLLVQSPFAKKRKFQRSKIVLFSDGTLQSYLSIAQSADYFYNIKEFNETPSHCRHVPFDSWELLAYDGLFYSCKSLSSQHTLVMYQPGWPGKCCVTLSISVTISQSYADNRRKYLLLGNNDDESMRLLLIPLREYDDRRPVEVKTIPLTWAQARVELNRLWEEKYGKGEYKPPKDSDSDWGMKIINSPGEVGI